MYKKAVYFSLLLFISECFSLNRDNLPWSSAHPQEELARIMPACPYILEAGARLGEHTVWFVNKWPKATVYSFEANPSYFDSIRTAIARYPSIHFFPYGVAPKSGEYDFYISRHAIGANSLLPSTKEREDFYLDEKITVFCRNLDEWFKEENIAKLDLIWFDLEGIELSIFKSIPAILSKTSIIYTEVNFQEFRKGMAQFDELYEFLTIQGFRLHCLCPIGSTRDEQADAIFINRCHYLIPKSIKSKAKFVAIPKQWD